MPQNEFLFLTQQYMFLNKVKITKASMIKWYFCILHKIIGALTQYYFINAETENRANKSFNRNYILINNDL